MRRSWPSHLVIVLFVLAVALGVGAKRIEQYLRERPGPLQQAATLVIEHRHSTEDIARQLESSGVVQHWWLFELTLYVFDRGAPIKAGEYQFAPGESLEQVVEQMRQGRTVVHHLTVPEGLSVAQILALVALDPALSGAIGAIPPEGSLMPDTYNFSLGEPRAEMIARMRKAMEKTLREAWAQRAPGLVLRSPEEALALASIVEKETGVPDERPKVAAVFLNRLGRGMKLQSDPTVIYAITAGKRPLGRALDHADLSVDSPFNSYRHDGLPPTPIDCPGRGAIHAVLHPDDDNLLYFVADGTGRHVFAETLEDHNRNVARLRQSEAQPARAVGASAN